MAGYRKHWLINSLGERHDFTEQEVKTFLYQPQGFGFQRDYVTQTIGNSELVLSQKYTLTDISGDLVFFDYDNDKNYQAYQKFIQFCKYAPLEFHYQTPNDLSSYYCDVLFTQADKGEAASEDGALHVPVIFHRLTEWLTDKTVQISMNNDSVTTWEEWVQPGSGEDGYALGARVAHNNNHWESNIDNNIQEPGNVEPGGTSYWNELPKEKAYEYDYNYIYAGSSLSNSSLYNNGTDDIGFILKIEGEVQNPQFSLSQGGERYGICKINGTYDFVQINSIERTESIYLERNGSSITNPERFQDFTIRDGMSYLTWLKLKVGESQFAFTCGNIDIFSGTVTVSYKESYVSV